MSEKLTLGTRCSALAMWQAHYVADAITEAFPDIEVEIRSCTSRGDKVLDKPLIEIGNDGLFTKELEQELSCRLVDINVHSCKDVLTTLPDGMELGAYMPRGDVRDVLIAPAGTTLENLPAGAKFGTGSQRRLAQLKSLRPDLHFGGLRGNVPTRISRTDDGTYDAVLLAAAGVERLGLKDRIAQYIDADTIIPAVGQGAVVVQCRTCDERIREILAALDDPDTRLCVEAERKIMRTLGGGCEVPFGTYARIEGDEFVIDAVVAAVDASRFARASGRVPVAESESLVATIIETLEAEGAREILEGDK